MPRLSQRLTVAAVFLAASLSCPAADPSFAVKLDPARTRIEWMLTGNVHDVHGTFRLKRGNLTYDTGTGKASGELSADAASGESGSGARDKRMRSSILETDRYPEIRFVPETFSAPVGSPAEFTTTVSGAFTLHGATHALSVPLSVKIVDNQLTASGSFVIPYVDWGLKDPSTFIFRVNKEVQLHITAVGEKSPPMAK